MSPPPRERSNVRWIPHPGAGDAVIYPRASNHLISERLTAWLVIILMVASAGLALYDLYLLVSGLR
jgi:hypothetical protein